jgi:hypothetical protein
VAEAIRMSEKDVTKALCRLLKPLDPHRVENALLDMGMPDICLARNSWLEAKYVKSYPVRESTPLRIPHYTEDQRRWAIRHEKAGGRVWLVLKVARDWYIFRPPESLLVGELTKDELKEKALHFFNYEPPQADLLRIFS